MYLGMSTKRLGWALLWLGLSVSGVAQAAAARVVVQPLQFERQTNRVDAVGTAEARQSVVLYPAVSERVVEVNFEPGDKVQSGDILLRLYARLQEVAVERAEILLADAERTVQRLHNISKEGGIPQRELDDAVTARDLAKVSLKEAQAELQQRYVRAPFSGYVGLTDVQVGDRITTGTAITSLDNRSTLFVNFRAPESALSLLLGEGELMLQPWQSRAEQIPAQIAQIDSRVNNDDRTVRARALMDNQSDRYRPGMSFRVNLVITGESYAAIPEAALSWGATSPFVWLAHEKKAKRVEVQIIQRLRGRILVAGALSEGDLLVTEGVQRLRDKQPLELVEG